MKTLHRLLGAAALGFALQFLACAATEEEASNLGAAPAAPSAANTATPNAGSNSSSPFAASETRAAQTSPRVECAAAEARRILEDETGEKLARAYDGYALSELEGKIIATWWWFVLAANETGVIDPVLPDVHALALEVVEKHAGSFERCGAEPALGAARQRLIKSSRDFKCGESCVPSGRQLQETALEILKYASQQTTEAVRVLLTGLTEYAAALAGAKSLGGDLKQVIDTQMPNGKEVEVVENVAKLAASAAALVAVAASLPALGGASGAVAGVAAEVAAAATIAIVTIEIGKAAVLIKDCLAFQGMCPSCTCALEVVEYGNGSPIRICAQWKGSGARAFCSAIQGSSVDCCTCDSASRDAFQRCSEGLAFEENPSSADYEACCRDAKAISNSRAKATPACPCQPPSAAAGNLML